ncbi:MAG: class I SAM-dependent methyltransferase [Acholeplasmataceae bacterium]
MKHYEMLFFVDYYLNTHVKKDDYVLDMTLGNGNDTLKLSTLASVVTAFDIQEKAISISKERLDEHNIKNVTLVCDSHENYHNYVNHVDGAIFNLGYLPSGDKTITTKATITLETIKQLLKEPDLRFILVTCYQGHEEGKKESLLLLSYLETLEKPFQVSTYQMLNKTDAPFVLLIEK